MAFGSAGVRLYRNNMPPRERLLLTLIDRETGAPALGCNVRVRLNDELYAACNGPVLSSTGCDDPRMVFVHADRRHKVSSIDLAIYWPNGIERHYNIGEVQMDVRNTLIEPTTPGEPTTNGIPEMPPLVGTAISPNPFNPTTTIHFTLSEALDVQLEVYNLVGQKVATLANGPYAAGTHRVSFDGRELPSGIYFSRLSAGGTVKLNRLLLAK